jgi:hypothetical protein
MTSCVDPITHEPFTDGSRTITIGRVKYDFDVFYDNIHKMNGIPHSREPFDNKFKQHFNKESIRYGKQPIFASGAPTPTSSQDVMFIIGLVLVSNVIVLCLIHFVYKNMILYIRRDR